jgi:3-oxoacyl-[acyl-carrier protein] reductase
MKGLSVLIVGGGSGLGALLARMAVEEGATGIGIIDIDLEAAESALRPVREKGLAADVAECDIQIGPQCHLAFGKVAATLGRVDTLINCAAIYPRRPILEITDAEWDASNGINIKGTYHMMVAAVRHMQAQEPRGQVRGRIVNLTSVDAFKAHPQKCITRRPRRLS